MLALGNPYEAYRKVEFDARVNGADSFELVHVCYDQLILALSTALRAHERRDVALKSRSLTRAISALVALQMGVDADKEMADQLIHFYDSARKAVLGGSVEFDPARIGEVRDDFVELRDATRAVAAA